MNEILTNELIDLMAERYLVFIEFIKASGATNVIPFEKFLEGQLKTRKNNLEKVAK